MDLQLAELRAFLTLAEQLHFGHAADQLHLTQPALSKQIQRLEHKIGGPLVVRRYRDVRLTAAGQALLTRARPLLRDAVTTMEAAQQAARGRLGTLRIGFGIATVLELLPNVLLRFRSAYPDVELRMRDMSTPGQLQALVRGDLDVGFVRLPVADPRIVARPILHERLVLALGPKSPWRPRLGLVSVAQEPFITIARTTSASFYDHVVAVCRAAGFTPNIVQEASELFTVLMLVRAGMGVALVPSASVFRGVPGVRVRPVAPPEAAWDIGIAWSAERVREPLLEAFLELTQRFYRPRRRSRATKLLAPSP
jgi:DNA-binding transcriptional LysR family regulator